MDKRWKYLNAFIYVDHSYITWIRPCYIKEDGSIQFDTKVEVATKKEIKEAEEASNLLFMKFQIMSDGITDSRKKISREEEIKMESYRIEMMVKDLKNARKALKELQKDK